MCAAFLAAILALAPQGQRLPTLAPTIGTELRGLLGDLFAADSKRHAAAELRLAELPDATRCALARWGLRSDDPATALGAAAIAEPRWLDVAEQRRLVAVALERSLALPAPFSFEEFRDALTHADVGRLLLSCPQVPREVYQLVGFIHRGLRPEHVPALSQLVRCDDVLLREDALRFLVVASWYTDAHRNKIADAVLSWPGEGIPAGVDPTEEKVPFVPRAFKLPEERGGWPRMLQAVLDRLFVQEVEGELLRFSGWALRWALDAAPGEHDLALLVKLAASRDERARAVAARRLVGYRQAEADGALRTLAKDAQHLPSALALAALAQHGEADARDVLWTRAKQDEYGLAAFLTLDDAAAIEVCALAFGPDREAGRAMCRRLADVEHLDRIGLVPARPELPVLLAVAATTQPLDDVRLHALLDAWPATRTGALRRAYLARLTPQHLPDCHAGLLEVTDAEAFAAKLDAARDHDVPEIRDAARALLLRLGAAQRGVDLLAHFAAKDECPVALARSRSPQLIAALAAEITAAPTKRASAILATLLACHGLDERLAGTLADEWADLPDDVAAAWLRLCAAARAGDAPAAVAAYLETRPFARGQLRHLFHCAHPAVHAYLARARAERHHGLYAWATAELARLGEPDARTELAAAHAAGLYPWFDDLPAYALVDPDDPASAIASLRLLEGNCCLYAAVANDLEDLVEWDGFAVADDALCSRPVAAQRYFTAHLAHLRFSRIEGRHVVVR